MAEDIALDLLDNEVSYGDNEDGAIGRATQPDPSQDDKKDDHIVTTAQDITPAPRYQPDAEPEPDSELHKPATTYDIITHSIHVEDDPSLPAITFRSIFLGLGLSAFSGVISAIYYYKPQTVTLPTVFLAIAAFVLGEGMARFIPRVGTVGRFLNPGPFNMKEHLFITIMANAASIGALGIEIVAAERLFYNRRQNDATYIFLMISAQTLGYGMAGLMRSTLVYPIAMLWPSNVPISSMIESLHRRSDDRKPLRIFGWLFLAIFIYEIFPEWIMPILTGISVFCLAKRNSQTFTNIFGGAAGNEGLGLFSICLDWQYISGGTSPLYFPLSSLISQGIGVCGCIILFSAVYYSNIWNALQYPFLSQLVFSDTSTSGNAVQWNQTAAIGTDNKVLPDAIENLGLPQFSASNVLNVLMTNMCIPAALVHLVLWYPRATGDAFPFLRPKVVMEFFRNIRTLPRRMWSQRPPEPEDIPADYDPHYSVMIRNYKLLPNWWFALVLVCSVVVGIIICHTSHSGLPVWAFLIACLVGYLLLATLGTLQAITGVSFTIQSVVQMISGYLNPGNPVANMYFSLYGYNALLQGIYLARDLKLGQYGHLAPRLTFAAQMIGTIFGVVLNYYISNGILENQADILRSVEGTNIWSGNQVQQFNAQAVTFGGFPHQLFSVGGQYQWVSLATLLGFVIPIPTWLAHRRWPDYGLNNINMPVIIFYLVFLNVGINSSLMSFFVFGLISQGIIRRRYPNLFVRYNYLVSAALDGGTSVMVFILSFAVLGAAGAAVAFPKYWGNNSGGNIDYCYSGGS